MADLAPAEAEHFDRLGDALQDLRLDLAIRRDNQLTREELIAALDVYQEFGR